MQFLFLRGALLAVAGLSACAAPLRKFEYLRPKNREAANLYVYRPTTPPWMLRTFEVDISRFRQSFKDPEGPELIKSVSMEVNQYVYARLQPGFYELRIKGREETRKILLVEKGSETFIEVLIYSTGVFAFPRFYLPERTREEALPRLLELRAMDRNPASED